MQVRALASFDGREPSSYLLDPAVNDVPEVSFGGRGPAGRHALRSIGEYVESGRRFELVALAAGPGLRRRGLAPS